jgi:ABC-type xylose transport system permease subunit
VRSRYSTAQQWLDLGKLLPADVARVGFSRFHAHIFRAGEIVNTFYAIGGNPEAATLVGIPVKWGTLKTFLLLLDVGVGQRLVIIGQVLIVAVVFDAVYRRATGERMS